MLYWTVLILIEITVFACELNHVDHDFQYCFYLCACINTIFFPLFILKSKNEIRSWSFNWKIAHGLSDD